ncbi:MAG: DNA-3-methyladenine glycosylase 2 [Nevskia sp.]|nr:DNA-3-methyladenine glycosylase 2 [Nevskia sp.]
MQLDPTTCYRAVKAHDARFDGRFFVAVSSTRIYCRPICTAKTPKAQNCRYFPSAAAAESLGYRPCLRCRPELAPGNASVDASHRLAQAAASLIEDGALADDGLDAIAAQLGVTDRHLRRVFQNEFGVAPVAYAQTQRLLLAKRLLTDTQLPITEVAFASGFGSLRRFNALFHQRYRLNPGQLRKSRSSKALPQTLSFELSYRPPYDWPALLKFLGARCVLGVEAVDDNTYRRVVHLQRDAQSHIGWIEVMPVPCKHALRVRLADSLARVASPVLARVKQLMDLSAHPDQIAAVLGTLARNPGLRMPGAFDAFEMSVRAVLGQQISVAAARTLAGRFAAAFGTQLETPFENLTTTFPTPQRITSCTVDHIAALGIIAARARSILALANALASGELVLSPGADVASTLEKLRALPGIGEWTAQYIAMRALAWPDAFPHSDLGVLRALGLGTTPKQALAAAEAWRPWRAYAVMHLWQRGH